MGSTGATHRSNHIDRTLRRSFSFGSLACHLLLGIFTLGKFALQLDEIFVGKVVAMLGKVGSGVCYLRHPRLFAMLGMVGKGEFVAICVIPVLFCYVR